MKDFVNKMKVFVNKMKVFVNKMKVKKMGIIFLKSTFQK